MAISCCLVAFVLLALKSGIEKPTTWLGAGLDPHQQPPLGVVDGHRRHRRAVGAVVGVRGLVVVGAATRRRSASRSPRRTRGGRAPPSGGGAASSSGQGLLGTGIGPAGSTTLGRARARTPRGEDDGCARSTRPWPALKRAGVNAIFGLPGGPVIPLFDALHDDPDIRTFLVRHEQGAGHMAEGYAKVTGRAGVCTATSGPGATNLVTPIADAYMDSVPLVAITGQVGSTRVGTDAFQEADIVGITLPIVKHSYLIKDAEELPARWPRPSTSPRAAAPARCWSTSAWTSGAATSRTSTAPSPPMPGYRPPAGAGHPRQLEAAARALAGGRAAGRSTPAAGSSPARPPRSSPAWPR